MKKKFPRTTTALCTLVTLVMLFSITAGALALYNLTGTKLTGGIAHVHYSFQNPNNYENAYNINYLSQIWGASNSWRDALFDRNNTTYFTYTTPSNSCDIYFKFVNNSTTLAAGCKFFDANGNQLNSSGTVYDHARSNYAYAVVEINQGVVEGLSLASGIRCIFAHEEGHTLGLAHMTESNFENFNSTSVDLKSIMYENAYKVYETYSVYTPQTGCDLEPVLRIYGYLK